MDQRDDYPAGVPCWVDSEQPDVEAAITFYGGLFGWEFDERTVAGSPQRYVVAQLRGLDVAGISSPTEGSSPTPVWNTYVRVDSADQTAAKTSEAGGSVLVEPFDVGDAGRMAILADPSGAVFCPWQPSQHKGAQLVNEHGTVNFNELTTLDLEVAAAFYGAVFGWTVASMGPDDGSGFWRMPGYGDHLEKRKPGMRAGMAEMGAPAGFEDAVALLVPLGDEGGAGEGRARWSTIFAVDDADTIAARVGELGGTVLTPPTDAPWVRTTVVTDPQGAVFTASQFVPPSA